MLKSFIPLNSEVKPTLTPHDVRTFNAPSYEFVSTPLPLDPCHRSPLKPCKPGKVRVEKPMTTEAAIFEMLNIPQKPRFQRTCNKKCEHLKPFTTCVMEQKTSHALQHNAIMREKVLKEGFDMHYHVHDAKGPSSDETSLIQMDSPTVTQAKVAPKLASPTCSLETFYVPSRKLLDLKRPKSGIIVNETPGPTNSEIPFEQYNPRILQKELEKENRKKYTLYRDGNKFYFPWVKGEEDIVEPKDDENYASRTECVYFKPVIFPIPSDLGRTFRAEVVFGNEALRASDEATEIRRPAAVACLYAAYVESFLKNPDYWNAKAIDGIIQTGINLCETSAKTKYEDPANDFDIIPEVTEKESTVGIKLHLNGGLTDEPNILKALTLFFSKYHAAILWSESMYLLIWKRCATSFYIFDPNGRDRNCVRDFKSGKASHMAIDTVEHIVHLVLNYSDVSRRSEFNLYEIHLKDLGKLSKPIFFKEIKPPKKAYAVVNRYYALIPALTGLPPAKWNEDNPSMMICYLALVYAQIDPPKLWKIQTVEDLIRFGKKYHMDFTADSRLCKLNIADLPEVLVFGNYRVVVEKKAFDTSGHVANCWSHRVSQLSMAIKDFLAKHKTGLIQVDSATFGLWREGDTLYVFDPFRRGPAGQALLTKAGAGCLQIHLNVDSLCRILFINATMVKTEGNFFLHAIDVKAIGTFNINRAMEDSTSFGTLNIKYPFDCQRMQQGAPDIPLDCTEKVKADILNIKLVQCLSVLSLSPCERTVSERDFIQMQKKLEYKRKLLREHSIQSITEEQKIPEFNNTDVIDLVVGEFICDLMTDIEGGMETKRKVCIEASKVLLESDIGHLEDLKLRLKRGEDHDNICEVFKRKKPRLFELTLDDELAMDSNFMPLPDGSWVIFGATQLNIQSQALKGILVTIMAAALSAKYKLCSWSTDVLEYALEATAALEERFWSYNHTMDLIFRKKVPKLQLGTTTYYLKVISNEAIDPCKLEETIYNTFKRVNKLLVICKGLSCCVMKRYNLFYMLMGCSCDSFGFRSKSEGPICLLRFIDIKTLARRIDNACQQCGKYVIVQLEVKNVTAPKPDKFAYRTESNEELMYSKEWHEKEKQKRRRKEKMRFIEHEIIKESKRLRKFQVEKQSPRKRRRTIESRQSSGVESKGDEEGYDEDSEASIKYKHMPGKSHELAEEEDLEQEDTDKPIVVSQQGYQLRDSDGLFKIQGTTALEERSIASNDKIKTCHFASAIAVLYVILRPLKHWDSQRIDKLIDSAKTIANSVTNLTMDSERIIKNVDVDEFTFEIKVQIFQPQGTFGGNIEYKLKKTIQQQRYFLIQISNGTYAVHVDEYLHLFDPYASMSFSGNEEGETDQPVVIPDHIPKQAEQNTASWILFADLPSMLNYIDKRAASKEWKTEFMLHTVGITSYKTVPKSVHLINLLTDKLDICPKFVANANVCTHREEIRWLNVYPNLVIWSRLNRVNSAQWIRGSPLTKVKNFDIEIPDVLFSLWGSIHPLSSVFKESRGKQHLAINVLACCVADVYQVDEWNSQLLDSIVIYGDDYFNDSIASIDRPDYEISLEHLNTLISYGHLQFEVYLESVTYGLLYTEAKYEQNLAAALSYFFTHHRYGIIQCMKRSIAIGKTGTGYFMFECQSHGLPLFANGEGASYVLKANLLQVLLYCIVMTLNLPYYNAHFTIHKVEVTTQANEGNETIEDEG